MKRIRKGFTLIEMVIVLFIISLLLLIMIPNLAAQKDHADKRSEEAFRTTLKTQAELYYENHKGEADSETVTLGQLVKEKYITDSQEKHAKQLKIDEKQNLLGETDDAQATT
ncbi:competence type IV pilus major pilin ComGC [Companilactobacillus halodurans]|uniref:Prepilin-type N-terminal cleavage/methylation domain-containing protein n=1 Tax=Companilactobacillus halodurans TaxID=2584183 RepID=A0A5P0ZZA8_9LACO|nr:competence type IV pilus major pilin ComGC [Companilactobacillus halodurans]MQS76886.1 prepilin-type N-terminal cleavage/methylation domain-containing protein [Companilactobacillus halodurans]MQS98118.1 prepilin-type N-terminal cleavage/methylation domain-containing protein [Companilactobacillus halodurans]